MIQKNKKLPMTTTNPSLEILHAVENPKPDVACKNKNQKSCNSHGNNNDDENCKRLKFTPVMTQTGVLGNVEDEHLGYIIL